MKLKRITNPNTVAHLQWAGTLVLLLIGVVVGLTVVHPYTMGGDDYDDILTYSYMAACLLLPLGWLQSCGWWRQDLLNKELQAKYDELAKVHQRSLPVELFMALFMAMDASRPAGIARVNWGVSNNPSLVDVRTYMIELEKLVNRYGASWLIELARTGRTPFDLDSTSLTPYNLENVPPEYLSIIQARLREAVGATNT